MNVWMNPWRKINLFFFGRKKAEKQDPNKAENANGQGNDDQEILFDNALSLKQGPLKRVERTMPRTYNIIVYIIIPLLSLIGLSFVFGLMLASVEGPGEKESNNQVLQDYHSEITRVRSLLISVDETYKSCIAEYATSNGNNGNGNNDDLITFMDDCTTNKRIEITDYLDKHELETFLNLAVNGDFTYNWVTCGVNETSGMSYAHEQSYIIAENWMKSLTEYKNIYLGEGLTESEAIEKAYMKADGSETCAVNYTGGAIFWFTIMTTIGYGNTAPVTIGGRILVIVLGFVSILLFSAVMGHAGYIMVTIVDDFFNRVGLKKFTKGIISVLFWMIMLLLWLLVIAGVSYAWSNATYGQFGIDNKFFDSFWFAYISVTTIGFGDMFIPHDVATPLDMFVTPLLFLTGFVILANFLVKFSELVVGVVTSSSKDLDGNMNSVRIAKEEMSMSKAETGNNKDEEKNEFLSNDVIVDENDVPSFEVPYHENTSQSPLNAS